MKVREAKVRRRELFFAVSPSCEGGGLVLRLDGSGSGTGEDSVKTAGKDEVARTGTGALSEGGEKVQLNRKDSIFERPSLRGLLCNK